MGLDQEVTFASALASHSSAPEFHTHTPAHEYFQTSLLSAVMQGVFDGTMTIGELLTHGDLGLGTFNGLDGEMIILDGVAYRLTVDGKANVADNTALTPYAAVISFEPDRTITVDNPIEKTAFEEGLDVIAGSPNLFYAVRFTGRISHIKYRSVSLQNPPYKPLLEVVKTQTEFDRYDMSGTILGFRCPDYAANIGVPGYHLHFISDDRQTGGHVLHYALTDGKLEIDHTGSLHLELPEAGKFLQTDLEPGSLVDDIRRAEGE